MSNFTWPEPDTVRCAAPCAHTDCAEWRASLAAPCWYCRKPFVTGVLTTRDPERGYMHTACAIRESELARVSSQFTAAAKRLIDKAGA